MATQALQDTFQGGTVGGTALNGHVSDSGHTFSTTPTSDQNATLVIDQNNTVTQFGTGVGAIAVTSWTPPSTTYGIGAWTTWYVSNGGDYECGVMVNGNFPSGGQSNGYAFQGYTGAGGEWMIGKDVAGAFSWVATTPHTFTGTSGAPEKHFLFLKTAPDGSGGTILTAYVDGTQVLTYHDTSSPFTAAGQAAIRVVSQSSTATTGVHVSRVQTDAQVSSISGASSGNAGVASGNITVALEVPSIFGTSVALSSDSGGTFTPASPLSIAGATASAAGASSASFTYTPPSNFSGTAHLTVTTSTPTTTDANSPWAYAVAAGATLSGPSSGFTAQQSAAFTVTLASAAGLGGVVVTPASTGPGDTFQATVGGPNVANITIPQGQTTGTFYVTAGAVPGGRSISVTSSPSLTFSGSPIAYTSGLPGVVTTWTYLSVVYGFASGLTTVGYTVYRSDGTVLTPRTTSGVSGLGSPAGAAGYMALVALPFQGNFAVAWDDGTTPTPNHAVDVVNPAVVYTTGSPLVSGVQPTLTTVSQ